MQTLIITDNIRQAEFIQKGFRYENLSADVCSINDYGIIKNYIPYYDGIFILCDSINLIRDITNIIRSIKISMPIFILTQKIIPPLHDLKKEITIDMIFTRPFAFRNITSEMRFFIFQKKENIEHGKFILRDLELDLVKHMVIQNKNIINLRNKEFALLHYMMINTGKVLSRTEILENVWDRNANILTNTVDVHISQLRKKIEKGTKQKYIHTIPCTGYILS